MEPLSSAKETTGLLHTTVEDVRAKCLKVDVVARALKKSATAAKPVIEKHPLAVTEEDGFREALDCDILFSCVDRPWPRYVLNYIAYAYLIPVIDGGILIRMHHGYLRNASWRSHAVYPGKRCLACIGQYDPDLVNVERQGQLDDPTYIENLPVDHMLRRNENVLPFSTHLASSLVLHALHVALNPVGFADVGEQMYHFVDGTLDSNRGMACDENCFFPPVVGKGDLLGLPITGVDVGAAKIRTYVGSADLGEPIHYGYSYSLPHRDFMTSGDSPLVAGFQSYWKSNPYLTSHFTGESDALHPQWVVIDMGTARAVNAIHIQWVNPYAVVYVVQYWVGDNNAMDWDMGPNGIWKPFQSGAVLNGSGGDVHLKLSDTPVTTRFVRVLMSKSSGTCDTHGAQDIRNCVGYALQTLSAGAIDSAGNYAVVYPADGVEPGPGAPPHLEGAGDQEVIAGSAADLAGSFFGSSIDPWHQADNLITGGRDLYNGMDNFFASGLTMGHPALVACAAIYDTPQDCANEVSYIHKRGYPVVGIEVGEECDGKHMTPEDYGAIYIQVADAVHKLTPSARLGGPIFEGVDKDITLWADDEGRTSWMERFVDYLKAHGHLKDLSFMSFEHYPFMINGFNPPNDWATLYMEPGIMKRVLHMWREDGVPADVPLIISESGITAGPSGPGYLGVTGEAIWECDAFGTFFEQGGTAFYRPAINNGAGGDGNLGPSSGPDGGGAYGTPAYTPYSSAHLINFEWLQHGAGANKIFPASADLRDAAARTVVTSYVVERPDGNWSLMLINHDLNATHPVHIVIDDAKQVSHSFVGSVALVQYCNTPAEDKNITIAATPDGMYTLPAGSITVIRGKLR